MTLLEDGFLDDQLLTAAESERLRGLLIRYEGDGKPGSSCSGKIKGAMRNLPIRQGLPIFISMRRTQEKECADLAESGG